MADEHTRHPRSGASSRRHRRPGTARRSVRLPLSFLVCCSVFAVALASLAYGQTSGKISGTVTEATTGEPLPGVQIIIEETGQGTVSAADGFYSLLNVKAGTYSVVFRFVGFAPTRVEDVRVEIDKTTPLDVAMQEEIIEGEEVVVTAERPLVQMDRTTTTSYVDEKQIEALPVANIGEIINLQAGVVDGHFRGGRTGEVSYLVNGVPINNPQSNTAAFDIEKNMVSGLEVISGVFNAEYGQAMSGIVNIVTKGVPNRWAGSFSVETGAVASTRDLEFVERTVAPGANLTVNDFRSVQVPYYEAAGFPGRKDAQLSIGGPILPDRFGVRMTGRYFYNEGTVIGRRLFAPSDSSEGLNSSSPQQWVIESTGDQEFTPDFHERYSLNGTANLQIAPGVRLEYNLIYQRMNGWNLGAGNYRTRKYVPEGTNHYYNNSQFHLGGLHLALSTNSYAKVNYSYMRDRGSSRLYDVPDDFDETGRLDDRYVSPQVETTAGVNAFAVGGNDLFSGHDLTETHTLQADYTNQLDRVHQVKAGVSARLHHLYNGSYGIEVSSRTSWQPMPAVDAYGRDTLDTRPYELAAYIQDKMEYQNLIVNAGLRFDYFEPDFDIPVDWTQANALRIPEFDDDGNATGDSLLNRKASPARYQLSPRVGIAFPISADGVIRFSAGLFFQVPQLSILYTNSEYEVNPSDASTTFGNAALDPERTLHFEIGLQQGLTASLGLELTLFSKDIRNLTGVEIRRDVITTNNFVRYINRDVGTSRGVTLSLFQRPVGPISWDLDYTLQFANGTSSNPTEAFDRFQAGQEDILTLVRLDWDRRHVLTNSVTFTPSSALTATVINRFQTGTPYTTVRDFVTSYIENNGTRPNSFVTDLRVYFRPPFLNHDLNLTVQVDNLFDEQAHTGVYSDTGRSDESVTMELFRRSGTQVGGINSLDEYYVEQWRFSTPRRVIFGINYRF